MTGRSLTRCFGCLLLVVVASRAAAEPTVADTVVESLSATRHTSSVRLDALDSSYRIAAPEAALENERLVLRNLDPRLTLRAKLSAEGRPDLSSADGMLRSILSDAMSEEEKAIAIWKLIVAWRYDYISAEAGAELQDPVKLINVYGYGLCGEAAAGVSALSTAAGMSARTWDLTGHVVAEIFYAGGWHMFDADHEVFYRAADGHILSVAELAADPSAILSTPYDPVGAETGFMASLYTSSADNTLNPPTPASTHSIAPVLQPLDEASFDLAPGTVYSQSEESRALYPTYGPPPSFANGTLTRQFDVSRAGSEWVMPVGWPFPLVGGDVTLSLARDDADAEISIACNGTSYEVVPAARSARTLTASLRPFFAARRIGAYWCNLRIRSLTPLALSESIGAGQAAWLFQFAPRALQQVGPGGTTFHAELFPVGEPVPADWHGFEIVHAWGETHDFAEAGAQHFAQPGTTATDLLEASASVDANSVVVTILTAGSPVEMLRVYLDTDVSSKTGYREPGIGADYRVEYGWLYAYTGQSTPTQNVWKWSIVGRAPSVALRPDVRQITIPRAALGLLPGGKLQLRVRASDFRSTWLDDLPRDDARWQLSVPHVFQQSGTEATDLVRADVAFDSTEMLISLHTQASALQNFQIYLDTDSNASSGYTHGALGAEFIIENGFLYRYSGGVPSTWSWTNVAPVSRISPATNLLQVHVPLASLGLGSGSPLTLQVEHWLHWETLLDSLPRAANWRIAVPNVIAQAGASVGDLIAAAATVQPGSIVFTLESLDGPVQLFQLFLDSDADPSTGYAYRGLGSDFLIENSALWRFTGQTAQDWSWSRVGAVELRVVSPNALEVTLPTAGLQLDRSRASVVVEHWQDWITPLDSLPREAAVWELAW